MNAKQCFDVEQDFIGLKTNLNENSLTCEKICLEYKGSQI